MPLLSCSGQSNCDISSVKTFYTCSRCFQTKLVRVGTGSIFYSDFCPCTLLVPTVLYGHPLGPTNLPAHSPCPGVRLGAFPVRCAVLEPQALSSAPPEQRCTPLRLFHPSPTQRTGKKLWLHLENCAGSLKAAGKRGLEPWVAEILTSAPTAFPHLNLPIFKCFFLNTEPV